MNPTTPAPQVSAIANWFGSSRMVADRIGPELAGCSLVVVPFAGGMSELPYIDAPKMLVNDKHRHVINLARVIACPVLMPELLARLESAVFHPDTLRAAQAACLAEEATQMAVDGLFGVAPKVNTDRAPDVEWATNYFISTWMGRGGNSGTRGEFAGALPIRYSPNGGGSAQRFWGAVASVDAWHRIIRRCEFTTDDAFDVLVKCHDSQKCGIYVDAPWPDAGDGYRHTFGTSQQVKLAKGLREFVSARVVVRFADHPQIRELYPEPHWTWLTYPSRAQTNGEFDEVLLINGESYTRHSPA